MNKISAVDLSKYILAKLGSMSHLKLQKLIYYVEAYHLAYFEESIIEEDFEAWVHGPVVREVWDNYKNFDSPLFDSLELSKDEARKIIKKIESILTEDQLDLINDVFRALGEKSSYELERLTHEEKPWREARNGLPGDKNSSNKISKDTMKNFYHEEMFVVNE